MKFIRLILSWLVLHSALDAYSQAEFYGPFPSWADVKTRFAANGSGKRDDTKSLQNALDSFTVTVTQFNAKSRPFVVLYLPAGIYNISKTLVLKGKIGVSIIGEDPANTIIRWTGSDDDTMLCANGSAYFRISRLTFDAGNKKNIECLGVHWIQKWKDQFSQSYASLNIELSDLIFKGRPVLGISGGTIAGTGTGSNDSEITIKRCVFYGCTQAGILITGWNALDYWIWDSKFIDCNVGVANVSGNFHIYRSLFKRSKVSDLTNTNGYYCSVRQSYSINSKSFSIDAGAGCGPFKRVFQGNTVLNTTGKTIEYYHLGSITLLDNVISSLKTPQPPLVVHHGTWCSPELSMLSVGNEYGYAEPLLLDSKRRRLIKVADKTSSLSLSDESVFEKNMPPTPTKAVGKIFEVPRNASSATIQNIINDAAASTGSRPIVHFALGKYYIDKTITIPAGADMCIVGDGLIYASELLPSSMQAFSKKFLLEINGPSFISIQDMQIGVPGGDPNNVNGLLLKNIDQKGAVCIVDQLYSLADTSLMATGLNYLYIEKNNSFFSAGNYISGGKLQSEGQGTFKVNFFGGQFAHLTVLNNAKFLARDCWWEGPQRQPLNLTGDGDITIDGAMMAPSPVDSQVTIRIQNFRGRISLLNMYIQGGIGVKPNNKDLKLFGWNLHFYHKLNLYDFINSQSNYKVMLAGITVQNFNQANPAGMNPYPLRELKLNIPDENAFTLEMLNQSRRTTPLKKYPSSGQASSIHINRVTLGYHKKGITIVN